MPLLSVFVHLGAVLLYDFNNPREYAYALRREYAYALRIIERHICDDAVSINSMIALTPTEISAALWALRFGKDFMCVCD